MNDTLWVIVFSMYTVGIIFLGSILYVALVIKDQVERVLSIELEREYRRQKKMR